MEGFETRASHRVLGGVKKVGAEGLGAYGGVGGP